MASVGPIDEYVAALRASLRGPGGAKRDLLTEARDSLLDAAEAFEGDGHDREAAERLAVEEFGAVGAIAPGYQEELAVGQGRRTAALLFIGAPMTAFLWAVIWKFFPESASTAAIPQPGWFSPLARAVDSVQLGAGVIGAVALLVLGRGLRVVPRPALVTRWMGLFVWLQFPIMLLMCLGLTIGARGPEGFSEYAPGVVLSYASYAFWAWQLHSAARCLVATRRPAVTSAGPARFLSRS
ncbi:permease prefix domain 1-containing protein [Microbispora sp. NPDC049125]|uniref:permease prefix domain 1-containing protein n=1 Tax=Microbispora sp. NPDC049125 TaxID=3154929 RepID=UPI003467D4BD